MKYMAQNFENSKKVLSEPAFSDAKNTLEFLPGEQKRSFSIEVRGQKFDFLEIASAESSSTLLLHLPGFGEDAEQYAEPMHILMGKSYCTLALKGYGEAYSKESLVEALEQAIQLSGKQNTVLHGDSFGAAVVYDLISDPVGGEFLKRNNVVGAILETPFLDKEHLRAGARSIPDNILLRGSMLFDQVRGLRSLAPQQGLVELSRFQKKSMLSEALRKKTAERKIEVPVHVVFSQNESLSDNGKIIQTLQSQAKEISSSVVMSANDNGHHIASDAYENMWRNEKEAADDFIRTAPTYGK